MKGDDGEQCALSVREGLLHCDREHQRGDQPTGEGNRSGSGTGGQHPPEVHQGSNPPFQISDVYEPNNSLNDGLFITKSVDAQSHFESLTQDVLDLYKTITGQDIDLINLPPLEEY